MAFSLNKIMLIGNLGRDAETRFTTNNVSVTSFTIATSNSYKGKDGNWVNETTWHNIVSFNLSDYFKENLKKGKKFYIEGRLTKREYTDKEGIKRYATDVVAEKIIPLESGAGSGNNESAIQEDSSIGSTRGTINEPQIQTDENDDLPF
ncbi:MAG: single-stranded DNA-binding protein [Ignavibacteriaceae bacterium]|jgi:single-strand DNA-binding protein